MQLFGFFESHSIDPFIDIIGSFIVHQSVYMSVFLLLLEEAGVPLPVPGDVILAFAGYQIRKGLVLYPVVFLTALTAVLLGSSLLYWLSVKYGQHIVLKVGKYMHIDEKKMNIVEEKFRKYGPLVIIFGRHIPGFRIPITIVAGISGIPYKVFLLSTFISVVFWIPIYLSVGERLGPKTLQLFHSHPWSFIFTLAPLLLLVVSFIFMRFQKPPLRT